MFLSKDFVSISLHAIQFLVCVCMSDVVCVCVCVCVYVYMYMCVFGICAYFAVLCVKMFLCVLTCSDLGSPLQNDIISTQCLLCVFVSVCVCASVNVHDLAFRIYEFRG